MVNPMVREVVPIPDGVNVSVGSDGKVTVKGKNGTLERVLTHPLISVKVEGKTVTVTTEMARKKTRALAGTFAAHIKNMTLGATKDYEYHLKPVFSHFPIKTKVSGDVLLIENFLGEKTARKARIMKGAKVKASAEEVIITGPDVEAVSQTAANIEQACRVRGFDPRVFQDGIYITVKGA